jgi:hypothetical protein
MLAFELTKSMSGNVDAALRFFIKYKNLKGSWNDPM